MFARTVVRLSFWGTIVVATPGCAPRVHTAPAPVAPVVADAPAPSPEPAPLGYESPGGMWVPAQLAEHAKTLQRLGRELPPASLSDPMAYPLGAVVSLGGCSASFVSPDGLIVTNHHCVTGALQYSSKPGENLLEQGYLAKTRSDEKWNGPAARVYVTRAFSDVTTKVRAGLEQMNDAKARHDAIESREKELIAECEKAPHVRCEVAEMFGGGQYLLIERLEIKDVRLVYAPHSGIGNFGGEIDNWRWPRHTGDFSFLRAYVNKNGAPAEYSTDNVPYRPRMHLKLPSQPLSAGDLVFVAGYPGRTYRLYTAEETVEAVDWYYPKRIELFEEYLATLERLGKSDEDLKIKATPLSRGLSNALTYTRGALEGLTKGGAGQLRTERDRALAKWIEGSPERRAKDGELFRRLDAVFQERKRTRDVDFALWELLRLSSLFDSAMTIVRMAEERPKADADREPEFQQRNWERLKQAQIALEKRYSAKLEEGILRLALERALRLEDRAGRDRLLSAFLGKTPVSADAITAAVERSVRQTRLGETKTRVQLLEKSSTASLKESRDPLLRAAIALRPMVAAMEDRDDARSGELAMLRPRYVAALREMTPGPLAPDANGTLRVTFGTVRGYRPAPTAAVHSPFTTLPQVLTKATGKEPFDAPPRLLEAARNGAAGPWADGRLGTVPVDFLADLDITGGNSGSPTLNARGELVGLAFDGNYEAMASDWVFMPEITRSIHVDARYMLWVMDAVDDADHLIREMGGTPALP